MGENLLPDRKNDVLSHFLQQPGLCQGAYRRHQQHRQVDDCGAYHAGVVCGSERRQFAAVHSSALESSLRQRHRQAVSLRCVGQGVPGSGAEHLALLPIQIRDQIIALLGIKQQGKAVRRVRVIASAQIQSVQHCLRPVRLHIGVGPGIVLDIVVDCPADQNRQVKVQHRGGQHQRETKRGGDRVGPDIGEKPGKNLSPVARRLLLLPHFFGHAQSSIWSWRSNCCFSAMVRNTPPSMAMSWA